ncbi:NAD-dependent epimerase/dehydratase family protein [Demequina sp.]|uniref:NAD-dependent epimerase/dehydratase family protein n=1 Tax=Demequina sp. TaxID=2050685 RepID=UPI0025C6B8AD|nr:NAD-dependent epimerase/dehydratase family protein [Demequina sp.]
MTQIDLTGIDIDITHPVLVTGATGYVAGWIVQGLLEAGATVHAAVRSPDDAEKVAHLTAAAEAAPGTLKLFAGDLTEPGSYATAMAGCGVVFHTASPFVRKVEDPQRDLVDPAVGGTRDVLETANAVGTVTRVVVTSSCAAIYTDASECAAAPEGQLTEDVWNSTASLDYEPYNLSKTEAEREAWRISDAQDRWRLVVINPSLVIGPSLQQAPTSESFAIVRQLIGGQMRLGAPRVALGVVDVRDLARAHLAAGFLSHAEGRHIVSGPGTNTLELGTTLREHFGSALPLPRYAMPKWLLWLIAPLLGISRRYVEGNVGHAFAADNSKSKERLGVTYRPMRGSLVEMVEQMLERDAS